MKLNFKRIASVLTSAVMLTSTVAIAAAATYPQPFVKDGVADVAVVYGSAASVGATDLVKAQAIATSLREKQLAQVTTGTTTTSTTTTVTGESKPVEKATQKLYMGDYMNATKDIFSKTELPTVLADGKVTDSDGKEFTYTQRILTPKARIIYGETSDNLSPPVIYTELGTGKSYTLRLSFNSAANVTKLKDKAITLFGKQYSFTGSASELTPTSITLFEKSQAVKINSGESKDVNGHTISVTVSDTTTAYISVDGVSETMTAGSTAKINGVDIYLKTVVGPNVAGTERFAELYLNSNKIVLTNGTAITYGSEDVTGTNVVISSNSGKVSQIDITVTPSDVTDAADYLKLGDSFTDPAFNTLKFSLASATPSLTNSSDRELIQIKPTSDNKAGIKFTNKEGGVYDMTFLAPSSVKLNETYSSNNATAFNGVHTYNATKVSTGDYDIAIRATEEIGKNDYFITCNNEYTQVWKITALSVTGTEAKITVRDEASGVGASSSTNNFAAPTLNSEATLSIAGGGSATISLSNNSTTSTETKVKITSGICGLLYTEQGAVINLTGADAPAYNTSTVVVSERTDYNEGRSATDNAGSTLGSTVSTRILYQPGRSSGYLMNVNNVAFGGTSGTNYWSQDLNNDNNDVYTVTKYGSFIKQTGSTDKTVQMYYSGEPMTLGFYIGEVSSSITGGSTSGNGTKVGDVLYLKDNQISEFSNKNLIVVGGSCINTVAAKLLNSNTPLCAADFTKATNVGAGDYLIKTFASPYNSSKIATLVAGYEAKETENAVDFLLTQNVTTAVGDAYKTGTKLTVSAG